MQNKSLLLQKFAFLPEASKLVGWSASSSSSFAILARRQLVGNQAREGRDRINLFITDSLDEYNSLGRQEDGRKSVTKLWILPNQCLRHKANPIALRRKQF